MREDSETTPQAPMTQQHEERDHENLPWSTGGQAGASLQKEHMTRDVNDALRTKNQYFLKPINIRQRELFRVLQLLPFEAQGSW